MKVSGRLKMEGEYVTANLSGKVICDRCGATLETYSDCPADLSDPCPGFVTIENAKQEFNEAFHYLSKR